MFLFALIGRELFAYLIIIDEKGELILGKQKIYEFIDSRSEIRYPRINFNNFWNSMMTVFILINGEDWVWVAQDFIRAYGAIDGNREIFPSLYFVFVMLFGHLTLFALFTGMLLHNF